VGMLLSTQNPVDLDYKAMSNAGTWCIGRLQTERDKARIMEALQSASGGRDLAGLAATISGLGKRQFLLHNTRDPEPVVFTTRWALSYLRGPLTRDEVARLTADDPLRATVPPAPARPEAGAPADQRVAAAPRVAAGTPVYYLDPAAPWAEQIGAPRGGSQLEAALAARVHLTFDDTAADLRHVEEWEAVFHPLAEHFDPAEGISVDYDRRDFLPEPPPGATYSVPTAPLHTKTYFTGAARDLKDYLFRARTISVLRNKPLKLFARVGEDREAFAARCRAAADAAADAQAAKIRDRFEGRLDTLHRQIEEARFKVEQTELDSATRRSEELASGLGTVIGVLLGGRRSTGSLGTIASKRSMTRKAQQRRAGAEARLTGKLEDLEELEEDLAEELADIKATWTARAEEIEEMEIPLEKGDILVEEVAVVWVPRA